MNVDIARRLNGKETGGGNELPHYKVFVSAVRVCRPNSQVSLQQISLKLSAFSSTMTVYPLIRLPTRTRQISFLVRITYIDSDNTIVVVRRYSSKQYDSIDFTISDLHRNGISRLDIYFSRICAGKIDQIKGFPKTSVP